MCSVQPQLEPVTTVSQLPCATAADADEAVKTTMQWCPLLTGVVGVQRPDDERSLATARGDQRAHPCAGRGAVRGGVRHHQGPVPRRVHRCHAAS
jgi:hypothetical protein